MAVSVCQHTSRERGLKHIVCKCVLASLFSFHTFPYSQKMTGIQSTPVKTAGDLHTFEHARIHSSHVEHTITSPTWQPPLMFAISVPSHQLTCQPNLVTLNSFKRFRTKTACLRYQREAWQLPTSHSGAVTFFNTKLAECRGHFEWTSKEKALQRSLWTDGHGEGFPSSYVTYVGTSTSSWGFLKHN